MKITLLALLCAGGVALAQPADFTAFGKTWQPRHPWPAPKTEPGSGFRLGDSNRDAVIRNLKTINGVPIKELEYRMRPGFYSPGGFLGLGERLLDVLLRDNDFVVEKKHSSHRQVALALKLMEDIGQKVSGQFADKPVQFLYRGQRYEYRVRVGEGVTANPFSRTRDVASEADDEATTSGSGLITLKNLSNGRELSWSTMMPFLIQRYGFYEGEGSPYRVPPEKIFALLPFLGR